MLGTIQYFLKKEIRHFDISTLAIDILFLFLLSGRLYSLKWYLYVQNRFLKYYSYVYHVKFSYLFNHLLNKVSIEHKLIYMRFITD